MSGPLRAFLLMATASALFSVMATLAKLASVEVPSAEVVFFRGLVTAAVLVGWYGRARPLALLGTRRGLLVARGVLGGVGLLLFFRALSDLPVADTLLLMQTSPLWVLLLGVPLLRERVTTGQLILVPVILGGVALVLRPSLDFINLPGLTALAGSMFAGGAYLAVRALKEEPKHVVVLYFAGASSLASLPVALHAGWIWPSPPTWLLLVGVGAVSVAAQLLLTAAYRHDTAGRVAMAGYLGPLFAGGLDWMLWSHAPTATTVVGAAVILSSLTALQLMAMRGARADRTE
ncbi:MAG: DMT family transporter [Deltaproteobacteria bacterium]|nr:DMT family transporter [Deltaproteobacteria bacterium]